MSAYDPKRTFHFCCYWTTVQLDLRDGKSDTCHEKIHPRARREVRMKVKEAMHKGVEWVGPDTPVTELAKLMCTHNIGAIPIGENDRLIGMVTDRDIVCKGLAQDGFDVHHATARRDDSGHPLLPRR